MLSWSSSDKFLRPKRLRSPARCRFITWNRACEEPVDASLQRRARRHPIALSSRRQWTRQVSRDCSHSATAHMQFPRFEVAETRKRSTTEPVCELERERGRLLLLEEERMRLIEEKELVRSMQPERGGFFAD